MSRVGAYQAVAARCGTVFQLASTGVAPRIGGAITKHPLDRKVAAQAVSDLRQLGAEVRTCSAEPGDDRLFVYLSGCSFVRGDLLKIEDLAP